MRRMFVLSLALLALIGFLVPLPAFAQAPAAAPAPTFAITGFIDNVTSFSRNMSLYDFNVGRKRDSQWYARTRGRFDIIGQVGPAKAVFGFEIDSVWGQTGFIDSNNGPGCVSGSASSAVQCGAVGSGNESSFDINTDTQGNFQVKWLYTEFPMPLVPFATIVRLGAQPFATAATYKLAVYANGDFGGVNLYTTFSPEFKLQVTYAAIDENLTGKPDFPPFLIAGSAGLGNSQRCTTSGNVQTSCQPQTRGDNFAIIISPEITPFKGLDVKPMYSYVFINGQTSGSVRTGKGGVVTTTSISGATGAQTNSPFAPAGGGGGIAGADGSGPGVRSEEHTSELQS